MIFVVRSDGELLYADSGSLPGAELPAMLTTVLRQSGRQLNDVQAPFLTQQVTAVEEALRANDIVSAARAFQALTQFGVPGSFGSYAAPSLKADELFQKISAQAGQEVQAAMEAASDSEAPFEHVLKIVEIDAVSSKFAEIAQAIAPTMQELKKSELLQPLIKPCEMLSKARDYAASDNARIRRRAELTYAGVIRSYSGTRAAELARAELAVLDPDADVLSESAAAQGPPADGKDAYRVWTSSDGAYTVKAKLVDLKDGSVLLKKAGGQIVEVPVEKLSEADRDLLRKRL